MGYQAGTLNQQIELQQKTITRSPSGDEIAGWSAPRIVWAAVHPIRGKEYMAADHLRATVECKFVVRYLSANDVDAANWRIVHEGKVYGIVSPPIHVRSAREYIEIMGSSGILAE